jgi:hypothetical protein
MGLEDTLKDFQLGLLLAQRGLLSARRNSEVKKIANTRALGVTGVSVVIVLLVMVATSVLKGVLFLAAAAGIERVHSWQAALHPVSVLSWAIFGASFFSLFVLRCVFDLDGPLFSVMASSVEAHAVTELRAKPTGSFLSHLGSSAARLGQHLSIALVCYISILFPLMGCISVPFLAYISTGVVLRQLEVTKVTGSHKALAVGLAFLSTYLFPSVRSCGPTVILVLKTVVKLGRSLAGSAKYIALVAVALCMSFPLASQLALTTVGLIFSAHTTTRELLYPLTARLERSAVRKIHQKCWAVELGFGLPFMVLLGIPGEWAASVASVVSVLVSGLRMQPVHTVF